MLWIQSWLEYRSACGIELSTSPFSPRRLAAATGCRLGTTSWLGYAYFRMQGDYTLMAKYMLDAHQPTLLPNTTVSGSRLVHTYM